MKNEKILILLIMENVCISYAGYILISYFISFLISMCSSNGPFRFFPSFTISNSIYKNTNILYRHLKCRIFAHGNYDETCIHVIEANKNKWIYYCLFFIS